MKNIAAAFIIIAAFQSPLLASYDEALALFEKKQYKESLSIIAAELEVAKDLEPGSPNYQYRFLAAHNHWKLGNIESAVAHFKRCADIKKDSPDPLIDLGLLMIDQKRYTDAEAFARKSLDVRKNAMSYYIMGRSSFGLGNFWRAKELLEKAIAEDPGLYEGYNSLGAALMKLKRYNQANTAFAAAMAMAPPSAEIQNNVGFSLEMMGKLKEALEHYRRAAALEPDSPVIKENLARAERKLK